MSDLRSYKNPRANRLLKPPADRHVLCATERPTAWSPGPGPTRLHPRAAHLSGSRVEKTACALLEIEEAALLRRKRHWRPHFLARPLQANACEQPNEDQPSRSWPIPHNHDDLYLTPQP
jgi:hypothetical protein